MRAWEGYNHLDGREQRQRRRQKEDQKREGEQRLDLRAWERRATRGRGAVGAP